MKFEPTPSPRACLWVAWSWPYSFCIMLEQEMGDPEWTGYTASWKDMRLDMRANIIDGGPWQDLADAERACEQTLRLLERRQ
jgi:hypothetical protein